MFVQFECGCIGLNNEADTKKSIIFQACDDDERALSVWFRDMSGKEIIPLTDQELEALIRRLSQVLLDGYRFQDLKRILTS